MSTRDPLKGTRYRTLEVISAGATCDVLHAEQKAFGRRVVVKIVRQELAADASLVTRMRTQAQALARLDHENVVKVADFALTPPGRAFVVMARLLGRTLPAPQTEPISLLEAVAVGGAIARGLEAVHALGVVHRDLRPAHVFLCETPSGAPKVKLIGFGASVVTTDRDFAAPEVIDGAEVDARADIYAAGAILRWLLAAEESPADLAAIVAKALEKKPAERFQAAAALASELEAFAKVHASRWPETELSVTLQRANPIARPSLPRPAIEPEAERPTRNEGRRIAVSIPDDDDVTRELSRQSVSDADVANEAGEIRRLSREAVIERFGLVNKGAATPIEAARVEHVTPREGPPPTLTMAAAELVETHREAPRVAIAKPPSRSWLALLVVIAIAGTVVALLIAR